MCVLCLLFTISLIPHPCPFPTSDLLSCLVSEADISLKGAQKRIEFTMQYMDREMQFNILLNWCRSKCQLKQNEAFTSWFKCSKPEYSIYILFQLLSPFFLPPPVASKLLCKCRFLWKPSAQKTEQYCQDHQFYAKRRICAMKR